MTDITVIHVGNIKDSFFDEALSEYKKRMAAFCRFREIEIKEDESGKLIWRCPNCGNTDQDKLFVARRTCGYIGTQFWNQGRTQEIKDRVLQLSNGPLCKE